MRTTLLICLLLFPAAVRAQGPGVPAGPDVLRVVVLGDFNGPYGSVGYAAGLRNLVAQLPEWQPDLVLLTGDLVAGQDQGLPPERFREMWAGFHDQVMLPLRQAGIPVAATMGNHDASSLRDSGGFSYLRERTAAAGYWLGIGPDESLVVVDSQDYPFNWSFRLGNLFVVVWDASSHMLAAGQSDWLVRQLESEAAGSARHRWLLGHLPLFGVAQGRDRAGEVLPDGAELARQLLAAGLDTYVSGHQGAWYPGEFQGLELLMAGGLGGRPLREGQAPVRSTVTVVDLNLAGVTYRTFDLISLEPVPTRELPPGIDAYGGRVGLSTRALPAALP